MAVEYVNEQKGILLYTGTYRVEKHDNQWVPVIYLKGRRIKLVESNDYDKIFYTDYNPELYTELTERFSETAEIKEKTIANKHLIKIVATTAENARKIAAHIKNAGGKIYEVKFGGVKYFTVKNFRPYFYIEEKDLEKFKKLMDDFLRTVPEEEKDLYKYRTQKHPAKNGNFIKIIMTDPRKISRVRDHLENNGVRTYEADVAFVQRYLIDRKFTIMKPLPRDIIYYDIEVLPKDGSVPDPQKAPQPIITIAYYTGDGRRGVYILPSDVEDEDQLKLEVMKILRHFFSFIEYKTNKTVNHFTTLAGWNNLLFDWPYLVNRAKRLNSWLIGYTAKKLGVHLYETYVYTREKIDFKNAPFKWKYAGKRGDDHRYIFYTHTRADEEKIEDYIEENYEDTLVDIKTYRRRDYNQIIEKIKEDPLYKKNHIELPLAVTNVDVMLLYKKFVNDKLPTYKLDEIAKLEGFEGKVPIEISKLGEIWKTNPELLIEYNLHDAELVMKIDEKRELVRQLYSLSELTAAIIDHVHTDRTPVSAKKLIDSLLLTLARENGMVLPTGRESNDDDEETYSGAYVHDPEKGVHEWVGVLDFNSLYPTIIRAFNISPETWRPDDSGDIKAPNGSFIKNQPGLLVQAVNVLYEMKMQIKKQLGEYAKKYGTNSPEYRALKARYQAVKGVLNSIYGVTGYKKFRLYKKEIAENITTIGRMVWHKTKEFAEELGYKVIYGDTDSQYYVLKSNTPEEAVKELEDLAKKLTEKVREWVTQEFNARGEYFEFDPDEIFQVVGFIAKKNYFGYVVYKDGQILEKPDLVYAGLLSRGDVSDAVKTFLLDVINAVLLGKDDPWKVIERWKKEVLEGKWDNEVVIWKSLNKNPNSYKSIQPHVRAYRMLIQRGVNPLELTKVGFVKVGPRKTDLIALAPGDTVKLTQTQREFVWANQFEKKIEVIKPILPPKKEKKKQKTLFDF